jgi:hypothetical protein
MNRSRARRANALKEAEESQRSAASSGGQHPGTSGDSAGTQLPSQQPAQPSVPLELFQQLFLQQQQQQEANLLAQREDRAAQRELLEMTLAAQREERAAQREEREASLAILRQSVESLTGRPLAIASSSQGRIDNVPGVQRSVSVHGGVQPPPNYSGPQGAGEAALSAPLSQSTYQSDRIGETMRDALSNRGQRLTSGDYHPRQGLPGSPFDQDIISVPMPNNLPTYTHQNSYVAHAPIDLSRAGSNRVGLETSGLAETQVRASNLKVPTYDGSIPWAEFERQFEVIAVINKWSPEVKAGSLTGSLRGSALSVLTSLADSELYNYESLSKALRLRFGNQHLAKLHLTRLESRRQGKNEDLATLGHDVERLARIALPKCDEATRDQLASSRFINAIADAELKHALSLAGPSSLREAVIKGLEIEALDRQYLGTGKVRQVRLNESTSNNKSGTREKVTPWQRSRGNSSNDNSSKSDNRDRSSVECGFCLKKGHDANHCFALKRQTEAKKAAQSGEKPSQTSWRSRDTQKPAKESTKN